MGIHVMLFLFISAIGRSNITTNAIGARTGKNATSKRHK